jgi:serine/threonine protein kinase
MHKIVIALGLLVDMQDLHSEHCIHGSLNLENILIDENFHPNIISHRFEGIANSVKGQIQRKSFSFIAPEIFLGENKNESFDVSGYGMIRYSLFEG